MGDDMSERRGPGAPRSFTTEMARDAVEAVLATGEQVTPRAVIAQMKERSGLARTPREDVVQSAIDVVSREREDARLERLVAAMPSAAVEATDAALGDLRRRFLAALADQSDRIEALAETRVAELHRRLHAADEQHDRLQEELAAERDARAEAEARLEAATDETRKAQRDLEKMKVRLAKLQGEDAAARRLERLLQGQDQGRDASKLSRTRKRATAPEG